MADLLEGIRKDVPSYCDMSSEFQDILLAETYPRGITVDFQNPVNKRFGITHSLRLTGKPPQSPFAPPQPAGGPSHRSYSIGAYLLNRHGTQISASHCVSTGLATLNVDHKWRQGLKSRLNVYVRTGRSLRQCCIVAGGWVPEHAARVCCGISVVGVMASKHGGVVVAFEHTW